MVDFARYVVTPQAGSQTFDPITQAIQTAIAFNQKKQLIEQQAGVEAAAVTAQNELEAGQRAQAARGFNLNEIGMIEDPIQRRRALTVAAQQAIKRGDDPQVFQQLLNIEDDDEFSLALTQQANRDLIQGGGDDFADQMKSQTAKASAVSEILDDGTIVSLRNDGTREVTDPEGNIVTGKAAAEAIQKAQDARFEKERKLAETEIKKQRTIAENKANIQRQAELKSEIGTRNRQAARSLVTINEALTLAQTASQGLSGTAKLKLAKIFPDIDVSDEGALDAATKQLALDQLQKFKGPTTDFEFGVVQQIAGEIGNSKSANIARLKALKRNAWFQKEEFKQLRNWKGDPDEFEFDFGATKTFGDRQYTLEQIQATAVANNFTIEETLDRLRDKFGSK